MASASSSKDDSKLDEKETETAPTSPILSPKSPEDSGPPENLELQDNSTVGKVRAMLGMLTKFIGVKDIVNLRISLPANFLDPVSNLEYWNYMDRPDLFAAISDSEDPLDRMLNVVKWWYSKETKWINGKIAKPYNSILGEQFLCHWDVDPNSVRSAAVSSTNNPSVAILKAYGSSPSPSTTINTADDKPIKVYCITEQISHHPPVSAFYYYCADKGIIARGVDHLCAKFTGTSVKVFSGALNHGIYITLESRDYEEYHATHPSGIVSGWLKASLSVSVADETIITCAKNGLRAILEYKDEPYFGRSKYAIQGKITRYDPNADPSTLPTKLSKIPDSEVLCHLHGSWKGQILYKKTSATSSSSQNVTQSTNSLGSEASFHTANTRYSAGPMTSYPMKDLPALLTDMTDSKPFEKILPPLEQQGEWESRKIWSEVTENINKGNFSDATRVKRNLEDKQRAIDKERKAKGELYTSLWFGFLDKNAIGPSIADEKELIVEGGEIGKKAINGKPFLRKSQLENLPWNHARE